MIDPEAKPRDLNQLKGPFNCYVTLFWTNFDTPPPPVTLCKGEN